MKWVLWVSSLLNIAFLFWQFHMGGFNPPVAQPNMRPTDLLLVSEYRNARRGTIISAFLDNKVKHWQQREFELNLENLRAKNRRVDLWASLKAKSTSKPGVAEKPTAPAITRKCFEVGPFADESDLRKWLAEQGLSGSTLRVKELNVPSDFQVYFPAAKNPEQQRLNKMMLNAKGLNDIWQVPDGDNKGALSLGVFADKQRAVHYKDQLAQRGIQSEVRQRFKTQQQWFAKLPLDAAKQQQLKQKGIGLTACSG